MAEEQRKMTHQLKQMLKSLILKKAREDLKREAEQQAEEKKNILSKRIEPLEDVTSMEQQALMDLCRELHANIDKVDEARYDVEAKVKKNDTEIEELNQKIFDLRGKFKRPPLRRVTMSAKCCRLSLDPNTKCPNRPSIKHEISEEVKHQLQSS